ncbi:autophagy-related protein 13-domain-containing protein [Russula dissimulans]|nr:autophagy-related protein 13-domain-containing protein [Russula dissimulans]
MSNEAHKADQIAYRYYTKLTSVVHAARATVEPNPQAKVDKWFNLETPDAETFKEPLRPYRSLSSAPSPLPFELQVLLSVPDLSGNQVLVCKGADSSRLRIDPIPQFILLESWSVQFSPRRAGSGADADLGLSTIYKHGIGLFRSIYTLLRVLPTWKLHKRLRRRGVVPSNRNANLNIELHVRSGRDLDGVLGFDVSPSPAAQAPPLVTESHTFPSVPHPYGNITLSVRYLTNPNFHLDELESLLSSRFFSLDEGADFTPTLVRNQQRESLSSSPGSLPLRTSLPASPPISTSFADRIARPSAPPPQHARTTSFPTSTARPPPLQGSRAGAATDSAGPSSASSRLELPVFPTPNTRLRKESMGSDLPSLPGPLPIRRPQLNPLNPFKASTLSSGSPSLHSPSPSLRQASPLPSRGPGPPAVPSSPRVPPSPSSYGRLSSSPIAPLRPSPPFQPGSLGDRRSVNSAEGGGSGSTGGGGGGGGGEGRKRYSSSFGHRYKDSLGGASEVSAGSAERKERESDKSGSPSLFGANPDEEDLSAFVNDASQPKPLSRHYRAQNPDPVLAGQVPDRLRRPRSSSPSTAAYARESPDSCNALGLGLASTGPLLTSEDAVDDQLRRMNATFVASLEMLGIPRRRERAQSSPGPGLRDGEYRHVGSPGHRVERISEITEEASGSESANATQSSRESAARAHMQSLISQPRPGSRTDSITSEEVIGKLELDERRQSVGH